MEKKKPSILVLTQVFMLETWELSFGSLPSSLPLSM